VEAGKEADTRFTGRNEAESLRVMADLARGWVICTKAGGRLKQFANMEKLHIFLVSKHGNLLHR
jgi:hypothetical protein